MPERKNDMTANEIMNYLNNWQSRPSQIIEIDGEEYYQYSQEEVKMIRQLENEEE